MAIIRSPLWVMRELLPLQVYRSVVKAMPRRPPRETTCMGEEGRQFRADLVTVDEEEGHQLRADPRMGDEEGRSS